MKNFGIIYKVTNKVNGKIYIGQTVQSIIKRKSNHISDATLSKDNFYFHNALRKYTKKVFTWEIIEYCGSKEELNEMEFHYIKQYDSFNKGYNMTLGGDSLYGFHHSKITKRKLSKANSGKKLPPRSKEWCIKISKSKLGSKLSEETLAKRQANRKYKKGSGNKLSKKFIVIYPDGSEIIVHGLRDFCKTTNFYKALSAVACGKRKHHKGYKCRYYNETLDVGIKKYTKELSYGSW